MSHIKISEIIDNAKKHAEDMMKKESDAKAAESIEPEVTYTNELAHKLSKLAHALRTAQEQPQRVSITDVVSYANRLKDCL